MNKECIKCGQVKPEHKFAIARGKAKVECKDCHNKYARNRYHEKANNQFIQLSTQRWA